MAIFADFTKTTYTEHESETVTETVTFSDNHPDEHLRGQTVEQTFPKMVESTTTLTNAYIVITNYIFYKNVVDATGKNLFDISYSVYGSKDQYLNDFLGPVYTEDLLGSFHTITPDTDLRVKGYEILKDQVFITNIIDD